MFEHNIARNMLTQLVKVAPICHFRAGKAEKFNAVSKHGTAPLKSDLESTVAARTHDRTESVSSLRERRCYMERAYQFEPAGWVEQRLALRPTVANQARAHASV